MTLDDARSAIRRGAEYGSVAEGLDFEARTALAAWYTREPSVPNLAARAGAKRSVPTLDPCPKCGGLLVRTGACQTCSACGESTGGCG